MATIIEKNYRTNPYVYGVINAISSFCRDYDESQKVLARNPNDIRAAMVRAYCVDFANWLSETMASDYKTVGETIVRMMEEGNDEE